MTDVGFVVLDLDGGEMLQRCLASIQSQEGVTARVIVVDNGSHVRTADRLRGAAGVEIIRRERNEGFAGGANIGIAATSARFVALVNNDVTLHRSWTSSVVAALRRDARVGAAQSVIAAPDGRIDGAGVGIAGGRIVQIGHGEPASSALPPLWGVSATAAIYRREALEAARGAHGYFDERFFAYYEDVELCARLLDAGWTFARVDEPLAVHEGSRSAHRLGHRSAFLRTRNRYYLARLHPNVARIGALLAEDTRRAASSLLSAPAGFSAIVRGVVRGLSDRVV